ncbi:MAG: redoxin domain-containing protein [Acidobacteriaceae bacterium]|nr:redoxin domain-containing protein [Acidobacteriaceae bacterium]
MSTMIQTARRQFLRAAGMTLAGSQLGLSRVAAAASFFSEGSLPSLDGATSWLNSAPLRKESLRGKVVLIDFWTYTCINWRRTLPFISAWYEKYGEHGLAVIGVHTPEFGFETDPENVRRATNEMNIKYPVAMDSKYAIWRAFNNQYWPALYLADAQGHIRYHNFGEGEYERSERTIQELLRRAGANGLDSQLVSLNPTGAEVAADWADLKSGENYVGYERTENFASRGGLAFDKSHTYVAPERLQRNEWALAGNWTAQRQAIQLNTAGGRIAYQFHARDLHLVTGPREPGQPVRFRVFIDGQAPGASHGSDVDEQGNGAVNEPRMYQLIRQPKPIVDRRFEIEFLDPGLKAFSFTFG